MAKSAERGRLDRKHHKKWFVRVGRPRSAVVPIRSTFDLVWRAGRGIVTS
jgi:hypothetical protein